MTSIDTSLNRRPSIDLTKEIIIAQEDSKTEQKIQFHRTLGEINTELHMKREEKLLDEKHKRIEEIRARKRRRGGSNNFKWSRKDSFSEMLDKFNGDL
jgi:hypothetical protein